MELKIERSNMEIMIIDNLGEMISKLYFIPSFFIWAISSNKNFIITKDTDEFFYDNLLWLMNNSYTFPHKYSKKTENELIWFSEQCYNIEDELACNMTSRLIIKKVNNEFHISYSNPFFEENNLNKDALITFSPAGNGFLSKNIKTGLTLQDDMVNVFYSTIYRQKINDNTQLKKIR